MTVRYDSDKKMYEVADASGVIHARDKVKANAYYLDARMGFAPAPTPALDAIVKGVHGALVGFGYSSLTADYCREQVVHILKGEFDMLTGGPGRMAQHIIENDIAQDHADVLARAKDEVNGA